MGNRFEGFDEPIVPGQPPERPRFSSEAGIPAGMKRCPACAELIREEAVRCRYCRYDYRVGSVGMEPIAGSGPQVTQVNVFAVVSPVVGALALVATFFLPSNLAFAGWQWSVAASAIAIGLGSVARSQIDSSRGQQGGRALATMGIVMGVVGILVPVFAPFLAVGDLLRELFEDPSGR